MQTVRLVLVRPIPRLVWLGVAVVVAGCGSTITRTVTVTSARPKVREMTSQFSTGMPAVNAFLATHMQNLAGSMEADPHNRNERIAASQCQLPVSRTGVLIEQVAAGSPAQKAGLEGGKKIFAPRSHGPRPFAAFVGGDVIVAINGKPVTGLGTLDSVTEGRKAGQQVKLSVLTCRDQKRTVAVTLVDGKQANTISQELAAATPRSPTDTPQPEGTENVQPVSRETRDAILSATDIPRSAFDSFCINAWASASDPNFATYEVSTNPSCDTLSERLGDNTTILERERAGQWRVMFTGTGPNTSCKDAPGIPTVVADDFSSCPGQY